MVNMQNSIFWMKMIILIVKNKFKVPTTFRDQSLNYEPNMNATYNFQNLHDLVEFEESALKIVTNKYEGKKVEIDEWFDYSPQPRASYLMTDENCADSSPDKCKSKAYQSVNKGGRVRKKEVLNNQKRNTLNELNKLHKFKPVLKPNNHKTHMKQYSSVISNSELDWLIDSRFNGGDLSNKPKINQLNRDLSNYNLVEFENSNRNEYDEVINNCTSTKTGGQMCSLYDEVSIKLKENAELDLVEKEMDIQFKAQIEELKQDYELAEKLLVEAMEEYVGVEEEVCNLESHDINVHQTVHDLMRDYQQIYEEIQREKLTDPLTIERLWNLEKEIKSESLDLQNITIEKELKNKILKENIEGIEKEYNLSLENQLNIQILNEKPYLTAIAVDFNKSPSWSSENISAQNHYFETVELFSQLKINDKDYKFNKVIRNEEIEYFTLPHLRHQLGFKNELIKYMIEYISYILQFVRRIQEPNWFYKGSFKEKKPDEEIKKEMEINLMNRKITIMFVKMESDVLESVLEGLRDIIGDNLEDVNTMWEHLLSSIDCESVNRVNLLTPNLDGSCDWEVEIIIMNPSSSNFQNTIESVYKNWQENKRMINIFVNVDQNESIIEQKRTSEILDIAIPYCDKYVTSNSLLFFF